MCEDLEVERFLGFRNQDCKFDGRAVTGVFKRSYETVIAPDPPDWRSRPKFLRLAPFSYAGSAQNLAGCRKSSGARP